MLKKGVVIRAMSACGYLQKTRTKRLIYHLGKPSNTKAILS